MKILAINSSHTGDRGLTQELLEQIKAGVLEAGADFEVVVLAKHRINPCLGCEVCHTEKSYLKCVYEDKDDVKLIQNKISGADIVIYATPIYVFNMSGMLKNFIDRINSTSDINILNVSKKGLFFHHIDASICSKPFVLLTTCGNIENETSQSVVSYFKTYSRFMDAPMVGTLVRKSSFLLRDKEGRIPEKKAAVLGAFRQAGKELAVTGRISKRTQKSAEQDVIDIPSVIRLLMKIKPIRPLLAKEAVKRNAVRFK